MTEMGRMWKSIQKLRVWNEELEEKIRFNKETQKNVVNRSVDVKHKLEKRIGEFEDQVKAFGIEMDRIEKYLRNLVNILDIPEEMIFK